MKHGQEISHHTETTTVSTQFRTPDGQSVTAPGMSVSETVSTRWCEVCNESVEARGIIGALLCVECETPWKEEYRE